MVDSVFFSISISQSKLLNTTEHNQALFDKRCELLSARHPALVKAHFFVRFAVGNRPVTHSRDLVRVVTLLLERQCHHDERLFGRLPCLGEGVGEHQSLVFDDL